MRSFQPLHPSTKHTAEPGTVLSEICDEVSRLQPGQAITIPRHMLMEIPSFFHNEACFTAAHRVLENIIGSAYTHSFNENPMNGDVTFYRHVDTGERRYSSPDDEYRRGLLGISDENKDAP